MTPEAVEAVVDSCFTTKACDVNHLSGLFQAAGLRHDVPITEKSKLQLQFLVLQCKLQVGIIDEDVADITSSLCRQFPELEAVTQHQILLRTQAALHDLEEKELPMDCFAETVEVLFEASDDDSEGLVAALADRKTELLRFCRAVTELAGTDSSAISLLVAQTTYSYPKAGALAALSEVVGALRAYLQILGPACSAVPLQLDAAGSPVAGCKQASNKKEQPVMDGNGQAGQAQNAAQTSGSPPTGLEGPGAGDMQQLSIKQSCANSDVDILNTPTSQSQRALVTRLGLPSRDVQKAPDLTPHDHGNFTAAGNLASPQPGYGGVTVQPADLTESQLLVPDSYSSDRPPDEAQFLLIEDGPAGPQPEVQDVIHAETQYQDVVTGGGPAESQPEAQAQELVHAETQYQDVMQDEGMPERELSEWQVLDQQAEEEVVMEEDGVGTENQENCSLYSNSQAPAADSQGKKGSQEDNSGGSNSPEGPQIPAPHGIPDVGHAEYLEPDKVPDKDEGLGHPTDPKALAAANSAENNALVEAHEGEPAAVAEAVHAPEAELVADAEEDFQDAHAVPSTDAESDEGSSESDYDSPSWQGSGEDLLFGSEQQDEAAKSQSESQEPVLHLSLGVDSFEQSHRALRLKADTRVHKVAQPAESQEAPLDPGRNSGPTAARNMAGEGEEATIAEQDNDPAGVPGSMARMTVVTKPDALAQPRRHRAKRRTLNSPKRVVRAAEPDQQGAADNHQVKGEGEAAEAVADEMGVVGRDSTPPMVDLTEEPAMGPEVNSGAAAAASAVTPDEVVRSFLRVRDGAAAAAAPPGGLTELMGVIQAGLFSGTAAAAPALAAQGAVTPQPSAAAVRSPTGAGHAHGSAAAADAASPVEAARSGTATGENGHRARDAENGEAQTAAAEPAWRTKVSAAARRDSRVPEDFAKELRIHASAPAAATRTDGGAGEDSWPSLIAGLSFSAALAAQPSATRAAAREQPLVPESAMEAQPSGIHAAARQPPPLRTAGGAQTAQPQEASLPAPASPRGPDQAQRPAHAPPQQADRVCGSRMGELHFHAPQHGSRTSVPQATRTPHAGRPSNGGLPGRPPQVAQQQRQECRDRTADATGPEVPVPSTNAAAAPVGCRTQPTPKRSRQQDSGAPLESPPPAAKRPRVQGAVSGGSGGSLWDLANNVMVHMAQRLMPGAPAVQTLPPQASAAEAPVPPGQQIALAPSVSLPQTTAGTLGTVEQAEHQSCGFTPPPLQTAALRAVVEAAINKPGAVALPTLVPASYQRAQQKAAAAVRAASARASAQRAAATFAEVPVVRTAAAPSSIGQRDMPTRMAHRPAPASASSLPDTGRRAHPMAQPASHREFEDEDMPTMSQELGAGMQHGAARRPAASAAGQQQPLTQLPSPGYDDAAMAEWPEQAQALQPLMPPLEDCRPFSAQPECMPTPRLAAVSGTAWRSTPAAVGPYPTAEVLSEQRHWPQLASANMRGTGRGYLGGDYSPAFAATREWGHREQDGLHVQAGAATLHSSQSLRSMPASPHGQAHNQVQQQQDFTFQRPQAQRRDYTPQHSDVAPTPGRSVLSRARTAWELEQLAAASGRAQEQASSAQAPPAQVHGCQQEMSPLLQAPHTYARQWPTPTMETGHPSLPAGAHLRTAVYGESAQEHPAAMAGTGYSRARVGGDPMIALYGQSLPMQRQPMWQHAPQMQEAQTQEPTPCEGTPSRPQTSYQPLAACSAPPPQQQPWQMSRPGFAPEQHQGQEAVHYNMAQHVKPVRPSLQQAPFPPPLQALQPYSPKHGLRAHEWHGGL